MQTPGMIRRMHVKKMVAILHLSILKLSTNMCNPFAVVELLVVAGLEARRYVIETFMRLLRMAT
jgi:hypothetical protein